MADFFEEEAEVSDEEDVQPSSDEEEEDEEEGIWISKIWSFQFALIYTFLFNSFIYYMYIVEISRIF